MTAEKSYHIEHPLALIDSEQGVSHVFNLSVYDTDKFQLHSEVLYKGVSASHSHSFSCFGQFSSTIQVANGSVVTYYGEFKHVYQEGTLYLNIGGWWWQTGHFKREFIADGIL